MELGSFPKPPFPMPDLTAGILARTSGPACGRLRDLACDFVDGTLDPDGACLVGEHLEHCPHCQGLVKSLREASEFLPVFAELDPGTGFTESVLQWTRSQAPFRSPGQDRLQEGWGRLLRRPRFCLEAAYLGTAAGFMAIQIPMHLGMGTALVSRIQQDSKVVLRRAVHIQGAGKTLTRRGSEFGMDLERTFRSQGRPVAASWISKAQHLWRSLTERFCATWSKVFSKISSRSAEPQAPSPRHSL